MVPAREGGSEYTVETRLGATVGGGGNPPASSYTPVISVMTISRICAPRPARVTGAAQRGSAARDASKRFEGGRKTRFRLPLTLRLICKRSSAP